MKNIFCNYLEVKPLRKEIITCPNHSWISKDVFGLIGEKAAVVLMLLIQRYNYLTNGNTVNEETPFQYPLDEMSIMSGLDTVPQLRGLCDLSKNGLLSFTHGGNERLITLLFNNFRLFRLDKGETCIEEYSLDYVEKEKLRKSIRDLFYNYYEIKPNGKEVFATPHFIHLSKDIVDTLSSNAALLLTALIEKHDTLIRKRKSKHGAAFYCTAGGLKRATSLSKEEQIQALEELSQLNFINFIIRDTKRRITLYVDKLNLYSPLTNPQNTQDYRLN